MPILSNPFADERSIASLAETLELTPAQVNTAVAAYLPRDTVEVGMIEQIMILRHNLHEATRAARDPSLTAFQADRLRRTVCTINRQLEIVSVRLEKRQFQTRGLLPQQYWRDTPIDAVGPFDDAAIPQPDMTPAETPVVVAATVPLAPPRAAAPGKTASEPTTRHHPDDPSNEGDALYQLARMRLDTDHDPAHLWSLAERDAERSRANLARMEADRVPA